MQMATRLGHVTLRLWIVWGRAQMNCEGFLFVVVVCLFFQITFKKNQVMAGGRYDGVGMWK